MAMDKVQIDKMIERQSRRSQWQDAPACLQSAYDGLSHDMQRQCTSTNSHHNSQVNVTRLALVTLMLLTAPFSLKALTRDYPYQFVEQNGVKATVGVVESLNLLFGKE